MTESDNQQADSSAVPGWNYRWHDLPQATPPGRPSTTRPLGDGPAIASLVLGIVSVITYWSGIIGLAAIAFTFVFGGIGMSRAAHGARGRGFAIAGLCLGAVSLCLYLILAGVTNGATLVE